MSGTSIIAKLFTSLIITWVLGFFVRMSSEYTGDTIFAQACLSCIDSFVLLFFRKIDSFVLLVGMYFK